MMLRITVLLAVLFAAIQPAANNAAVADPAQTSAPAWQLLAPDLETSEFGPEGDEMFSHKLRFLRTSLKKFRVGVLQASDFGSRRLDAKAVCLASKAAVCLNSNFFDEEGKALGLVVNRGITHQKIHAGGSLLNGIFQVSRRGYAISDRHAFDRNAAVEAVQAGPRLLANGRKLDNIRDKSSKSRRAGVCIDNSGRLLLFCSSSNIVGMSIESLQHTLVAGGIDCVDALNFDGGGSAQMYVRPYNSASAKVTAENAELFLAGSDEVPVFLSLLVNE